ncbi:hypothetical protein H6P81_016066 [Aristolochia fimbriata]|uniref:Uncharacterized protein n=1 Tax=Aristolochia fimbriata TaxID=158543 RepID=A0AAV7E8H8_ARIFI|nr:hypothetical protein H6P81_016066 [Aristolochia fimbriata]
MGQASPSGVARRMGQACPSLARQQGHACPTLRQRKQGRAAPGGLGGGAVWSSELRGGISPGLLFGCFGGKACKPMSQRRRRRACCPPALSAMACPSTRPMAPLLAFAKHGLRHRRRGHGRARSGGISRRNGKNESGWGAFIRASLRVAGVWVTADQDPYVTGVLGGLHTGSASRDASYGHPAVVWRCRCLKSIRG